MKPSDDPLAPPAGVFEQPWHAQVLAIADAMVRGGHFTQKDWARELGAALKVADAKGAPDTQDSYFNAALAALETLSAKAGLTSEVVTRRRDDWEAAYLRTPHGKPVLLDQAAASTDAS